MGLCPAHASSKLHNCSIEFAPRTQPARQVTIRGGSPCWRWLCFLRSSWPWAPSQFERYTAGGMAGGAGGALRVRFRYSHPGSHIIWSPLASSQEDLQGSQLSKATERRRSSRGSPPSISVILVALSLK